jgi:hypothetical protein
LLFEKNANVFAEIFAKIAENCKHDIDPLANVMLVKIAKFWAKFFFGESILKKHKPQGSM